MTTRIKVSNRKEAQQLRAGLNDPAVRAFVKIIGILQPLAPHRAERVLRFVADAIQDAPEGT